MKKNNFVPLKDLEVYCLSRELSKSGWSIYENLEWQMKKIMGDQFIESTDSVGANIAEGYARYHYLDKVRFFYNARGSLAETSLHWVELLYERGKITKEQYSGYKIIAEPLAIKLGNTKLIRTKFL